MKESKATWRFAPLCGGTVQGYSSNDIEIHRGENILEDLVREICQNSMDAHCSDEPVTVSFYTKEVSVRDYDALSSYQNCIDGCRKFWKDSADPHLKEALDIGERVLAHEHVTLFVAGDYGTTGLTGSRSQELGTPWESLVFSDGVSAKNSADSAGSHGVGKNAALACSSLGMVFYNTLDVEGKRAFAGTAKLATLINENGEPTQKNGRYQVNEADFTQSHPVFEDDAEPLRDLFCREEPGTDVIIAGFSETDGWRDRIVRAVLGSFFVAIAEGKLVVKIGQGGEEVINSETLGSFINSLRKYGDETTKKTVCTYEAFTDCDGDGPFKASVLSNEDVWIYAKSKPEYSRAVEYLRMNGMRIYRRCGRSFDHYAAVVIVRGKELNRLLRDTEPTTHDKWDPKKISDPEKRKKARTALGRIDEELRSYLEKLYGMPKEESTDAAGTEQFLSGSGREKDGESMQRDALLPECRISSVRRTGERLLGVKIPAADTGDENVVSAESSSSETGNQTGSRRAKSFSSGTYHRLSEGGKKTKERIVTSRLERIRAVPLQLEDGLYKIVIKPMEDMENVYMECRAWGDDGKSEPVMMTSLEKGGKVIGTYGSRIGPFSLKADTYNILYASLAEKGEMALDVRISA